MADDSGKKACELNQDNPNTLIAPPGTMQLSFLIPGHCFRQGRYRQTLCADPFLKNYQKDYNIKSIEKIVEDIAMAECIVEVCRIEKVQQHSNADALELTHIKGWQCVVPIRPTAGDADSDDPRVGRAALKYIGDAYLFSKSADRDTHDV